MPESQHDTIPDSEHPEHELEHEHGEGEHAHEHVPGEGVVATQRWCGDKCRQCLGCRTKPQTSASVGGIPSVMNMNDMSTGTGRLGG